MGIAVVDGREFAGLPQITTTSVTEYVLGRTFLTTLGADAEKPLPALAAETGPFTVLEVAVRALHSITPETGNYTSFLLIVICFLSIDMWPVS